LVARLLIVAFSHPAREKTPASAPRRRRPA
jgi:hypothetical protein